MANNRFPGYGRKRPQISKSISLLHLDPQNPRLPERAQGKSERELLDVLYKEFNLEELAESMAQNGYFDEEPLVAVPHQLPSSLENADPNSDEFVEFIRRDETELIVVEGNRRLATAKLLTNYQLREKLHIKSWPVLSEPISDDLRLLPAIVYPKRDHVIPYLGVRHIVGIQKWGSFAKVRYIVQLIDSGRTLKQVEELIGDKEGSIKKSYIGYRLLEQVQDEFDFDIEEAKEDFSLLLLAIGQGNIKHYIGLPKKLSDATLDEPVPPEYLKNLQNLIRWIFGDGKRDRVIHESRDITNYLSHIVANSEAVSYLESTGDLNGAFDRSDGEQNMLLNYLNEANLKLEKALMVAHRHKTSDVILRVERCEQTVIALLKILRDTP